MDILPKYYIFRSERELARALKLVLTPAKLDMYIQISLYLGIQSEQVRGTVMPDAEQ